jgi:hypothetical protein
MSETSLCGTDRSCEGCPLSPSTVPQGEYGDWNPTFEDRERLGFAAERLHENGYNTIVLAAAAAVVMSLGISDRGEVQLLQQAVERQGTGECIPRLGN